MPSPEEIENRIVELKSSLKMKIEPLLGVASASVFVRPNWGEMNFAGCIRNWDNRLRPTLLALQGSNFDFLEVDDFPALISLLDAIETAGNAITKFNIATENPRSQRDALQGQMNASIQRFSDHIQKFSLFLTFEQFRSDKRRQAEEQLAIEANSLIASLREAATDAQERAVEVQTILDGARAATAKIGVEKHSQIFSVESTRLHSTSTNWMIATIITTIVSVAVAAYFYMYPIAVGDNMALALQVVVAKIIIMSILVGAVVWCGKNYRALAHEASVNKHRANALSTFRTFVEATDEADIRNAVLLEATRSIFSQAPSGYLDKNDPSGSDTRVLEVVRSLSASLPKGH